MTEKETPTAIIFTIPVKKIVRVEDQLYGFEREAFYCHLFDESVTLSLFTSYASSSSYTSSSTSYVFNTTQYNLDNLIPALKMKGNNGKNHHRLFLSLSFLLFAVIGIIINMTWHHQLQGVI